MKTLLIASALIASIAAPVLAAPSSTAQAVRAHFAQSETGIEGKVFYGNGVVSPEAAEIFAQLSAEDTGTQGLPVLAGSVNLSSKGGHSAVASAIFAELAAAEDAADH